MKLDLTLIHVINALGVLYLHVFVENVGLVQKTLKFKSVHEKISVQNITMFKGIKVVFFWVYPSDVLVKKVMAIGSSTVIVFRRPRELNSIDCDKHSDLDYLIVIKDESDICSCVRSIPRSCLNYGRKLFIYKTSNKQSSICETGCFSLVDFYSPSFTQCITDDSPQSKRYNCTFPLVESSKRDTMMGMMIEVVTFHRPISTIIYQNVSDPTKRYDGLEMNIFMEIAKKLNLTWRVNELEGELDKWGQLLENGSWRGGIMEALTSGTAEIGFSTLWMAPLQTPYLDYTISWTTISSTFLVPRPAAIGISWKSLVRPFTLTVWCAVAISLLLFPVSAWATVRIHSRITREQHPGKIETSTLDSYIIYTIGSITGGSGMLGNRLEAPVRFVVSCWYVFILLLCSSYTDHITACLTLPSYTPKINSVQQLVEQHFHWGRQYQEDDLSKHLDFEKYWHRQFAKNFIVYNETHLKRMLMSKMFAWTVQKIESCDHLFMEHPIEDEIANGFRVMEEKIRSYRCAIAFRKHSPLLPSFNKVLQRLIETGLVQYFKEDAVRRFQRPAYKRIIVDIDEGIRSKKTAALTLDNYKSIFYILFVGLLISTGCFLIELSCQK